MLSAEPRKRELEEKREQERARKRVEGNGVENIRLELQKKDSFDD